MINQTGPADEYSGQDSPLVGKGGRVLFDKVVCCMETACATPSLKKRAACVEL